MMERPEQLRSPPDIPEILDAHQQRHFQHTIPRSMTAMREGAGEEPAGTTIRDEAVRLGPEGQLVGIVSYPVGGKTRTDGTPTVIVLNAGVLHRAGPHRLHVALTRRLAQLGFPG